MPEQQLLADTDAAVQTQASVQDTVMRTPGLSRASRIVLCTRILPCEGDAAV